MPTSKPNKGQRATKRAMASIAPSQQLGSRLLQLPRELRHEVFELFFMSTGFSLGEQPMDRIGVERVVTATSNGLALLRTCQQVFQETRHLWISNALFGFETTKALLDILADLPSATVASIRHIRIHGAHLTLKSLHSKEYELYQIGTVLKLLHHLRLDTLTVIASSDWSIVTYDTLSQLIESGNGWKELHFISHSTEMLGYAVPSYMPSARRRQPQPSAWETQMLERDGRDSGASVRIYRSIDGGSSASVTDPSKRKPIAQHVQPDEQDTYGHTEDADMNNGHGGTRHLLVVVKRGRAANIAESISPPFNVADDIRAWSRGMTWKQIKKATGLV